MSRIYLIRHQAAGFVTAPTKARVHQRIGGAPAEEIVDDDGLPVEQKPAEEDALTEAVLAFSSAPTSAQLDEVRRYCDGKYGAVHAKHGAPHWLQVVEAEVFDSGELKLPEAGGPETGAVAQAPTPKASGSVTVRNPK